MSCLWPTSRSFSGQIDNTDQAKIIFGLVDGTGQKLRLKIKVLVITNEEKAERIEVLLFH